MAGPRAQISDDAAQRSQAAAVAAFAGHVEDAGRAQRRILLQHVRDEVEVFDDRSRIRQSAIGNPSTRRKKSRDAADDLVVDSDLAGDGADGPVLGEVEAADLELLLRRDRHLLLHPRGRGGPRAIGRARAFRTTTKSRRALQTTHTK